MKFTRLDTMRHLRGKQFKIVWCHILSFSDAFAKQLRQANISFVVSVSRCHVIYVCMYACMCVCMYVYMYVCVYVCVYVCMYVCMYVCTVCLFVCVEQLGTRWTDFREILYWQHLLKYVDQIQVLLKSDEIIFALHSKRRFTWRPTLVCDISLNSSWVEKRFR